MASCSCFIDHFRQLRISFLPASVITIKARCWNSLWPITPGKTAMRLNEYVIVTDSL